MPGPAAVPFPIVLLDTRSVVMLVAVRNSGTEGLVHAYPLSSGVLEMQRDDGDKTFIVKVVQSQGRQGARMLQEQTEVKTRLAPSIGALDGQKLRGGADGTRREPPAGAKNQLKIPAGQSTCRQLTTSIPVQHLPPARHLAAERRALQLRSPSGGSLLRRHPAGRVQKCNIALGR